MSRIDGPGGQRVLVVDDDKNVQGVFNALLKRNGFAVDCAPNGRQALEYLRRGSYSVILLDLMMPDVNGFELLDRLERESPSLLRKVIVMTGAAQRVIDTLDTRRVWGLIRKPFEIGEMVSFTQSCASGKPGGNA